MNTDIGLMGDHGSKFLDRGSGEEAGQGQARTKVSLDSAHQFDGQQRVATQIKKTVTHRDDFRA